MKYILTFCDVEALQPHHLSFTNICMIAVENSKFSCNLWIDRTYFVRMEIYIRHSVSSFLMLPRSFLSISLSLPSPLESCRRCRFDFDHSISFILVGLLCGVKLCCRMPMLFLSLNLYLYLIHFYVLLFFCWFFSSILFMCVIICYLRLMPLPHYVCQCLKWNEPNSNIESQ